MRVAVALGLLFLLSGCLTHAPAKDAATPNPDSKDGPTGSPILRMDHASATYQVHEGLQANETRFSLQPQTVWSAAFDQVPGQVVQVDERQTSLDDTGGLVTDRQEHHRIGLDACGTPLWWWGDGDGKGAAIFYDLGDPQRPGWTELVASLQPHDLPVLDDAGRRQLDAAGAVGEAAVPARLQSALVHGDFVLHVAAERGVWLAKWTSGKEPLLAAGDWKDAVRLEWSASDPFPSAVTNATERWVRQAEANDGQPPAACFPGRQPGLLRWGPWGPEVDPPLNISWSDLVASVRANLGLTRTHAFLAAHPDAYLFELNVVPSYGDGLPRVPGVLDDQPARWWLWFGAPGATTGPVVDCTVHDGGPERPDAYLCEDFLTDWTSNTTLPSVDWGNLTAHDLAPWFDLLHRYGRTPDWLLYGLETPDEGEGRPFAVKLAISSDTFTNDLRYVYWDPQGPDSFVAQGFTWDEFLHPPVKPS